MSHWPHVVHLSYLQSSVHVLLSTGACLGMKDAILIKASYWATESVTAVMRLQGCTFVNQYVVVKTLGQGAYGKVKLCLNSEDHNLYALKLVSKVGTTEVRFVLQSAYHFEVKISFSHGTSQT